MIHLPFSPTQPKDFLEKYLSKRYFKKPYDRFMWWRSYTPKNKPLPNRSTFIEKIKNGDYDIGPYLMEIQLVQHRMNDKFIECDGDYGVYNHATSVDKARIKRLHADHEKEEAKKLEDIRRQFTIVFKMTAEQYDKEVMNTGAKDLEAFYYNMEKKYGTYWQPVKMPKNLSNQSIY
mgnify:FL=1